ncbi:MAG: hypothetical protein A3G20_07255 [Acidobacteria bacterium RIFCSPLOWO2_12_FULL_59_11]|nr:MAG: hypothetical protein A3G20_07255 [Acidobacteria bacterium RIFCSPLOWO2_12_FULL_59_11]
MTQAARVVLQDAKHAIERHSDTLQSEAFRVSWFAIVGLLRAVGHVLEKVDSELSLATKRAIKESWSQLQATRPEPTIFWGFIEAERNRFLKNYEHGISRSITVPAATEGHWVTVDCSNSRGGEFAPGSKLESRISDGPYAGCYEKDIAWEAYDWWATYLDEIDKLAAIYSRV